MGKVSQGRFRKVARRVQLTLNLEQGENISKSYFIFFGGRRKKFPNSNPADKPAPKLLNFRNFPLFPAISRFQSHFSHAIFQRPPKETAACEGAFNPHWLLQSRPSPCVPCGGPAYAATSKKTRTFQSRTDFFASASHRTKCGRPKPCKPKRRIPAGPGKFRSLKLIKMPRRKTNFLTLKNRKETYISI